MLGDRAGFGVGNIGTSGGHCWRNAHSSAAARAKRDTDALARISIGLDRLTGIVAALVPATPKVEAQSKQNRGDRDKPGHDRTDGRVVQ